MRNYYLNSKYKLKVFITNNIVRDILVSNLKTSQKYLYLFFYFIYTVINE